MAILETNIGVLARAIAHELEEGLQPGAKLTKVTVRIDAHGVVCALATPTHGAQRTARLGVVTGIEGTRSEFASKLQAQVFKLLGHRAIPPQPAEKKRGTLKDPTAVVP
jgi:hypothetical protein